MKSRKAGDRATLFGSGRWQQRGNKREETPTMSRKVTVRVMREAPCLSTKPWLGVTQVRSGRQRGSNDGHRDKPTTSSKATGRVTRVIEKTHVSKGFSMAMSLMGVSLLFL
jgi:hypothetical protein